jgi:thioredoxin 1
MIYLKKIGGLFITLFLLFTLSCNSQQKPADDKKESDNKNIKYKVTFIELGSVRCIPCQQMQPVMKSIEQKYGTQVRVVFHDVWTEEGAPYAKQYNIESIPTQIFLDEGGKEYFRHVGFFPEEELVKVLNQKGVK